jgi:dienelactone hydrolase
VKRAPVRSVVDTGADHLFTDPDTLDHDGPAADLAWQRGISFLNSL